MEGDYNLWADLAGAFGIVWGAYMEGWYYIFDGNEHIAPKLPIILLYLGIHGPVLNLIVGLFDAGSGGSPHSTLTENQRMAKDIHLLAESAKWNNLSNGRTYNGWAGDARPVGTKKRT